MIVLGVGGALAISGTISVGSFVAFGMYLAMLTWPLIALGWVINLFQRGEASMGRLNEILHVKPAISAPASPRCTCRRPWRVVRLNSATSDSTIRPMRPASHAGYCAT